MLNKDLNDQEITRLGSAGLKLFFLLSDRWELSPSDQALLLGISNDQAIKLRSSIKHHEAITFTKALVERLHSKKSGNAIFG